MKEIDKTVRRIVADEFLDELGENPYPGRGLVQGLNRRGDMLLQAYWVMGRSDNSRNRVLAVEDDVVRTEPFDPAKVEDPSLIIYNAMRTFYDEHTCHVVSNGNQTDTVIEGFASGQSFATSLESRTYEPDAPNYTPRITGIIVPYNRQSPEGLAERGVSVIRKSSDGDEPLHEYFRDVVTAEDAGIGECVHTYLGDGDPLPSFNRGPFTVLTGEDLIDTAEMYWDKLDKDNRVALVVKGIHLATGNTDFYVVNAHES